MNGLLTGYGVWRLLGKFCRQFLAIILLLPGLAAAEPVKIVALGDSLVHGYGLADGDGWVPQMQAWLDAAGHDAVLINAGVSGDTTTGGLARLDWALEDGTDALIVSLGGNDILRAIPPDVARANLSAILAGAASRGLPVLLIGIAVPPNYGPEYQADFQAIYPELADEYGTLLYANFLQALASAGDRAEVLARWFQRDGLHPNAEGVRMIVSDMGPTVAALVEATGQ